MKIALGAVLWVLVACGDPHEAIVPGNLTKVDENAELKAAVDKLSDDEKQALGRYMMRSALGTALAVKVPDRTVRDALTLQARFEEEQAAERAQQQAEQARQEELARQVRAEQEALRSKMAGILTFALIEKRFTPHDYRRGIEDGKIGRAHV